jgi:hypothetical protein
VIQTVPTSSKRRINQCLALSQKLKTTLMDKNNLLSELNNKKLQIEKINNEKDTLKSILEKTKQP